MFVKRTSRHKNSLTFSSLLNSLDGVLSSDRGFITIMTTNSIEKLDEALLRGGRIDRKFYFGPPTDYQIKGLFKSFYEDADDKITEEFLQVINSHHDTKKARSMSTLQELFVTSRGK